MSQTNARGTRAVIPPDLIQSMERFYGTSFSNVRLWTGSALPSSVGARAVAWNNQVWLDDCRPDFSSSDVIEVLAHELAHICQQRRAVTRPTLPRRVGAAGHRLETEAQNCARAFLSGGSCPSVTPDSAPELRRVLSIVPGSPTFSSDFGRAKPDIAFETGQNGPIVVCNLTNGYTSVDIISDALFWKGQAAVTSAVSDPAELKSLRFGFIQFMRLDAFYLTYIGQTPSGGEINLNAFAGLATPFTLDSNSAANPFMSDIQLPVSRGIAPATAGDHPASKAGAVQRNRATQANNFLYKIYDRRRFWTTFVAQNARTKKVDYLAYQSWDLIYDFDLTWSGGSPQVLTNRSTLSKLELVTPGVPNEVKSLANPPLPPFGNDVANNAILAALQGGAPSREDSPTQSTQAPANFFQ